MSILGILNYHFVQSGETNQMSLDSLPPSLSLFSSCFLLLGTSCVSCSCPLPQLTVHVECSWYETFIWRMRHDTSEQTLGRSWSRSRPRSRSRLRVMRELDIIVYGRAWRCIHDGWNGWESWWKRVEHNKSWQRCLMPASKSTSPLASPSASESHRINESGACQQRRVVSTARHPLTMPWMLCQLLLLLLPFARTAHTYRKTKKEEEEEEEEREGAGRKVNSTGRSHLSRHIRQIYRGNCQRDKAELTYWIKDLSICRIYVRLLS